MRSQYLDKLFALALENKHMQEDVKMIRLENLFA